MKIEELIERNPNKMGGTPVFAGTHVPIKHLFDCLEAGKTLDRFLDQFPSVDREQALQVLSASRQGLLRARTSINGRLELMNRAANDEMFLADLNSCLADFQYCD